MKSLFLKGIFFTLFIGGVIFTARGSAEQAPEQLDSSDFSRSLIATFSIVARDSVTGDLGVAVQSKFFAVGTVVPWAKAEVGAIATQAWGNTSYGPLGLAMLEQGYSAQDVVNALTGGDPGRARRQLGIVDAKGDVANWTGDSCLNWAGGRKGRFYTCQGNILTGKEVVDAMAETFEKTKGELAGRLLAAMEAGQAKGGDARGMQSAALLVVRKAGGYNGYTDRYIDLRVDDAQDPFKELRRLLGIQSGLKHLQLAGARYREGKIKEAISEAQLAVKSDPTNADNYYDLACYLSLNKQNTEALAALKKSLELNPKLVSLAKSDHDLDNIRLEPEFLNLVK